MEKIKELTMNPGQHDATSIASRLQHIITNNGGYQRISDETGISVSTLVRMATGKTSPKLIDIIEIVDKTNSTLSYIAYGFEDTKDIDNAIKNGKKQIEEYLKGMQELKDKLEEDFVFLQEQQTGMLDSLQEMKIQADEMIKQQSELKKSK
jgi:transcriptional regulator with XRE-family HTH domain